MQIVQFKFSIGEHYITNFNDLSMSSKFTDVENPINLNTLIRSPILHPMNPNVRKTKVEQLK